ncbi:uncharacterized protein LOC143912347 [Arctopsyche grandis]|uniref:uncharacterized protein LOC143912347 n=1 Tax=Arctopsyche grandis TaxID=121162 RepID=UPI00406D667A
MCRPFPAALAPAVFVEPTTLQSGEVTLRELSTLSTECNNTTVHKQTPVRCPYDVIAASSTVSPPPYSASTSLASALASASTPGQVAALSSTASPLPSSSSATLTSASASTSDYVPVSCAPASASTVDPSNSFSQVAGTSSGRLPYTRGSGAPDKTLQVATIPKLKNVHVFNLANNCTCDTVKQFILNKIKNKRINVSQIIQANFSHSGSLVKDINSFNYLKKRGHEKYGEISGKNVVAISLDLGKKESSSMGVCQRSVLSPLLFNLYSENITDEGLQDMDSGIEINCMIITNIRKHVNVLKNLKRRKLEYLGHVMRNQKYDLQRLDRVQMGDQVVGKVLGQDT